MLKDVVSTAQIVTKHAHTSMPGKMPLLFFSDRCDDVHSQLLKLRDVSHKSPLLAAFLRSTADALRDEIASLARSDWLHFPHFTSLLDLCKSPSQDGILSNVLLNAAQCGWLLLHVE